MPAARGTQRPARRRRARRPTRPRRSRRHARRRIVASTCVRSPGNGCRPRGATGTRRRVPRRGVGGGAGVVDRHDAAARAPEPRGGEGAAEQRAEHRQRDRVPHPRCGTHSRSTTSDCLPLGSIRHPLANPSTSCEPPSEPAPCTVAFQPAFWLSPSTSQNGAVAPVTFTCIFVRPVVRDRQLRRRQRRAESGHPARGGRSRAAAGRRREHEPVELQRGELTRLRVELVRARSELQGRLRGRVGGVAQSRWSAAGGARRRPTSR